jgi:hypothetical protein
MSSFNSLNIVRMEGKINAVIQRSIDSASIPPVINSDMES